MPNSADTRRTSENSAGAGALSSNQPRRLSVVAKRSYLTDLSAHSDTPAVCSHSTLSATGTSQPRSKRGQHSDNSYAKPRCGAGKACGSAEASVTGATFQRVHTRQVPPMGVVEAAVTSLQSVSDEASYARTSTTTSSLTAETLSPIHVRLSSVALAATAARSTSQQAQLHSISASASRAARKSDPSTVSSHSDLPAPLPEPSAGDAVLTPCLMSLTSNASSEHRTDTSLAHLPAKGPRLSTGHEKEQSMCDAANNGVGRVGSSRASDPVKPADKPRVATMTQGSGGKGGGGASGVRTEVTLSPPFLLGGNPAPRMEHHHVTDPAPLINGRKRRSRAAQNCGAVDVLESAEGESARKLPSSVPARNSAHSLAERLVLATSAAEEPHGLLVSSHAPTQLMAASSSAPHTPRRPVIVAEAKDCSLSALEGSRSNEGTPTASSGAEAVRTALGFSLPVASSSSHAKASVALDTPVHVAQPVSASPPQPPESAPTPPQTSRPSAGADGPPSLTALRLAAADGNAEAQLSVLPQRHRASSGTPRMGLALEHCSSSGSRSSSVVEVVRSPAPAHAQPPERRMSGSFSEATPTAPAPRRSSNTPRSPLTTAAPLPASAVRVHDSTEAEAAVEREASMPPSPQSLPELRTVQGSDASAPLERSLCAPRSGSCSTPLGSVAALSEDAQVPREPEEERLRTCVLLDDGQATSRLHEGVRSRSGAKATYEPEDEEVGAVVCSADAYDLHGEGVEKEAVKSSSSEPIRGAEATGHALITPCLRRRTEQEQEQQRELDVLCPPAKEHHQAIVGLGDPPETLIRGEEQTEAARGGAEGGDSDTKCRAADREETPQAVKSSKQRPPSVAVPSHRLHNTAATRVSRARPEGGPAVRSAGGVAAPITERSGTTELAAHQCRPSVSAASPPGSKSRETNQPVLLSSRRTNEPENSSVGNGSGVHVSVPGGRVPREGGSRARFMRALSCGALSGAVPPRATAALNSQVPAAAVGACGAGRDPRRRLSLPTTTTGGGSEQASRVASRRGDVTSGSLNGAGASLSHNVAMTTSEKLLPPLISEQEAANTITIVFDLDETLCNNRCSLGTILRPGAELLLRTLRGLCPSPRYKLVDPQTRSQRVANRLYDEAMCRMGVTPLYRSRVAQRQSANGYHHTNGTFTAGTAATSDADASGVANEASAAGLCSTGEARPATASDKNPLRLELVLWTASEETLARRAMYHIDPLSKIFDEAIYRDPRWYRDSHYTKELSRLGRCMERVAIVENSVDSVTRNRKNAILVTSFVRNRLDRQLFLVREVLRDWVHSMKAKLAEQRYGARAADAPREGSDVAATLDVQPRTVEDTVGSRVAEYAEEGGESPMPPRSSSSPADHGRGERVPVSTGELSTHSRRGSSVRNDSGADVSLRGAAPAVAVPVGSQSPALVASVPNSPLRSAPRTLSAMARRALNIAEFLKHHRLIFPDSNFLRFQLTAEVMSHLQATEATTIAAALSQPALVVEQADARVTRSVCHGSPRTSRAARAAGSTTLSFAAPVTATTATSAIPGGPAPKASHSGGTCRASPSGVLASMVGATAAATRQRASMNEAGAVRTSAAAAPASPPRVPAARTTRDSGPSSSRYSGVARAADAHRDPVRLQRTASGAPKRPVAHPS
ncbi:hypothetical protein LSCM4_02393 [Leishmania orientalis]|uniref:FCP1 homology domain-containing protein n=1 Tax=Leishmania orientalis TaxID=2249476 RepID=A0A836GBF3_9TRYP|nr:hypothetical protein LSCM4_02393 [Leishmania orientalis]